MASKIELGFVLNSDFGKFSLLNSDIPNFIYTYTYSVITKDRNPVGPVSNCVPGYGNLLKLLTLSVSSPLPG